VRYREGEASQRTAFIVAFGRGWLAEAVAQAAGSAGSSGSLSPSVRRSWRSNHAASRAAWQVERTSGLVARSVGPAARAGEGIIAVTTNVKVASQAVR